MELPKSTERLEIAVHKLQLIVVLLRPNPEAASQTSEDRRGGLRLPWFRVCPVAAAFYFQEEEGVVKEQGQVPGPRATNGKSLQIKSTLTTQHC